VLLADPTPVSIPGFCDASCGGSGFGGGNDPNGLSWNFGPCSRVPQVLAMNKVWVPCSLRFLQGAGAWLDHASRFLPLILSCHNSSYRVTIVGSIEGKLFQGGLLRITRIFAAACCTLFLMLTISSTVFGRAFGPPKTFRAGLRPESIATADFNHDGKLDLAVVDYGNQVSILLGNGDGTFQPAKKYAVGQGSFLIDIGVGDFNEDGNIDIVATVSLVGNNGGSIALLLGKGDGTFRRAQYINTGNSPLSIAVADLNGDHHLDLWVGGNGGSSVLLGKGDGTFGSPVSYGGISSASYGTAISDLNGDGKPDAIVTSLTENLIYVFLGNGDGTFQTGTPIDVGAFYPYSVVAADFNRDGKMDLAVSDNGNDSVSVLLGNGDGTFQSPYVTFAGGSPARLRAANINAGGKLDLVVADYDGGGVTLLTGNGDGTFGFAGQFRAGKNSTDVAVGRFNADKKLDLAVTDSGANTVSILLNTTK
jgi:hypothetical protein